MVRTKRVKVPQHAKNAARIGLLSDSGLTKRAAKILRITSGRTTAKRIITSTYIPESLAKQIARFYLRFRGKRTGRAENALNLWGGRKFARNLAIKFYKMR